MADFGEFLKTLKIENCDQTVIPDKSMINVLSRITKKRQLK